MGFYNNVKNKHAWNFFKKTNYALSANIFFQVMEEIISISKSKLLQLKNAIDQYKNEVRKIRVGLGS